MFPPGRIYNAEKDEVRGAGILDMLLGLRRDINELIYAHGLRFLVNEHDSPAFEYVIYLAGRKLVRLCFLTRDNRGVTATVAAG